MKFNVSPYKLTGIPDPSGWVAVHDFTPISGDLVAKKGRMVSIISMLPKVDGGVSKGEDLISKEIFTRLHENYFNKEGSLTDLLKESIKIVHQDFTSPNESLGVLVCLIFEDKILVGGVGTVESWVLRNGQIAKIIPAGEKIEVMAGNLMPNDIFYLGTLSFFSAVTPEILKAPASLKSLDSKLKGDFGAVILKVDQVREEMQSEISVPLPENNSRQINPIPKPISGFRIALAMLIDKILAVLPTGNIYVKEDLGEIKSNKKRKIATSAGAILLLLLIVSIIFGSRQQKNANLQAKYAGTLSAVEHDLDEAQSLASVDEPRARSLVLDANSQIQSLVNQKIKDPKITDLANRVSDALGQIAGLYNETPSMWFDLQLQSSGFTGDDLASSDNRMVVLNKSGKRLLSIEIDSSKAQMVAGPDVMPSANSVAAYSDRNFVSAADGIWEVGDKADNVIKKDWGDNVLISAYTGNFYILDKGNGTLWRYQGDGGVFGSKANWFGAGVKPDLSNVISWTIDGNIWLLTSDGEILRFSGGSPIDFSIKDLDQTLAAKDIFTTQDSNYLYILDSGNSRVLVVNKDDGSTKAQYIDPNIKNATKLVVSEENKKILLLENDKIYSLDIKHL